MGYFKCLWLWPKGGGKVGWILYYLKKHKTPFLLLYSVMGLGLHSYVKRLLSHTVQFRKTIPWPLCQMDSPPAYGCLSFSLCVTKIFPSASCLWDCPSAHVSRKETFLNLSIAERLRFSHIYTCLSLSLCVYKTFPPRCLWDCSWPLSQPGFLKTSLLPCTYKYDYVPMSLGDCRLCM